MKHLFLLLTLIPLLAACGPMKPQKVSKQYLNALSEQDFDRARSYITFHSFGAFEDMKQTFQPGTYVLVEVKELSTTEQQAVYRIKGDEKEYTLLLVLRKGNWRIELDP